MLNAREELETLEALGVRFTTRAYLIATGQPVAATADLFDLDPGSWLPELVITWPVVRGNPRLADRLADFRAVLAADGGYRGELFDAYADRQQEEAQAAAEQDWDVGGEG